MSGAVFLLFVETAPEAEADAAEGNEAASAPKRQGLQAAGAAGDPFGYSLLYIAKKNKTICKATAFLSF